MCDHKRVMSLHLKHDDRTNVNIPHLNYSKHSDYIPYIGIFGGDKTNITMCLDCGQIQGWKPITDDDIKEALGQDEE